MPWSSHVGSITDYSTHSATMQGKIAGSAFMDHIGLQTCVQALCSFGY